MPVKNFDVPCLDTKGQPIKDGDKSVMLADIASAAIWSTQPEDASMNPKDRNNMGSLGIRIDEKGGARQYSVAELTLIQSRAQKTASNLAFFRLSEVIDGPDAVVEASKESE